MNIRALVIGLGPIGLAIARQLVERRGLTLAGVVDIDAALIGRKAADVLGVPAGSAPARQLRGVTVASDIIKALRSSKPDVAILCTSSSLAAVAPQIEAIVKQRIPLVTTTEEAAYPSPANRRLAKRLDEAARKAKVAVLGTGVNPGFTMDALAITLTAVCERVDHISVERVQDARIRRLPFQQKIGAGMTPALFARAVATRRVRHVGFAESIQMIADAMGWRLDSVTDDIEPKIAARAVESELLAVEPGEVCGLVQRGTGYVGGEARITLRLEAYLGAPQSYDAVTIAGSPHIYSKIAGGVHGDIATASIAINSIPAVIAADPGFRTMRDIRLPSFYGGR